jgi:hypothetical protein
MISESDDTKKIVGLICLGELGKHIDFSKETRILELI